MPHCNISWILCYSHYCDDHIKQKEITGYFLVKPEQTRITCPCYDQKCSYREYQQHPDHKLMHWTACYNHNCFTHYFVKDFYPSPQELRQSKWHTNLSATQQDYHLEFEA